MGFYSWAHGYTNSRSNQTYLLQKWLYQKKFSNNKKYTRKKAIKAVDDYKTDGAWSKEETKRLMEAVELHGRNHEVIALLFTN